MRFFYFPKDHYWIVGGDKGRVYSSARDASVDVADQDYVAWLERGGVVTPIASMDDLIAVLRDANVPPYHRVRKSTIIARLTDGQLDKALGLLTTRQAERWRASDQPVVNADDPEMLQVLQAIGADPAAVMAPE
jgi:hypothetical protein